jgi:hypothetical protein
MAKTIPTKDVDFNVVQDVITTTAASHISDWGLDMTWFSEELLPTKLKWTQSWASYIDPAQRTPLITFAKNEAREAYEPLLRVLVRNLEANTRVTDDDRRAMGIVVPTKTNKPIPPPDTYPGFRIDSGTIRRLIVHFFVTGKKTKAKPRGVRGAEIRWRILDEPPMHVDDLLHSDFDTNSPFTLDFDENDRGKTVYFCLRWESNSGGKGPWSEIVSAIIP